MVRLLFLRVYVVAPLSLFFSFFFSSDGRIGLLAVPTTVECMHARTQDVTKSHQLTAAGYVRVYEVTSAIIELHWMESQLARASLSLLFRNSLIPLTAHTQSGHLFK